jgi:DNA-directed RNA polymerase specialized sigma24 family protein
VENARRKQRQKRFGQAVREPLELNEFATPPDDNELLVLHEALQRQSADQPHRAQLVALRFFGGMSLTEAPKFLGISPATADRDWRYARAWLDAEMKKAKTVSK